VQVEKPSRKNSCIIGQDARWPRSQDGCATKATRRGDPRFEALANKIIPPDVK